MNTNAPSKVYSALHHDDEEEKDEEEKTKQSTTLKSLNDALSNLISSMNNNDNNISPNAYNINTNNYTISHLHPPNQTQNTPYSENIPLNDNKTSTEGLEYAETVMSDIKTPKTTNFNQQQHEKLNNRNYNHIPSKSHPSNTPNATITPSSYSQSEKDININRSIFKPNSLLTINNSSTPKSSDGIVNVWKEAMDDPSNDEQELKVKLMIMTAVCHKLHKTQSEQNEQYKRLKTQMIQLQEENNRFKQQNMLENEYKNKLQEVNDENMMLRLELENKEKLIQCVQKNNNDELLDQYSNQLNEFQTLVIDIRNTKRKLTIENDTMKRILSEHDLDPLSSDNMSMVSGQTNMMEVNEEKSVETETLSVETKTLIEKVEEIDESKQEANTENNNSGDCCTVL